MDSRHWKEREEKNRWNTSDLFFNDKCLKLQNYLTEFSKQVEDKAN